MERLVLHEYARSGNCYKIRLTAAHVGAKLERHEYDIMQGETRTPEFLAALEPEFSLSPAPSALALLA